MLRGCTIYVLFLCSDWLENCCHCWVWWECNSYARNPLSAKTTSSIALLGLLEYLVLLKLKSEYSLRGYTLSKFRNPKHVLHWQVVSVLYIMHVIITLFCLQATLFIVVPFVVEKNTSESTRHPSLSQDQLGMKHQGDSAKIEHPEKELL